MKSFSRASSGKLIFLFIEENHFPHTAEEKLASNIFSLWRAPSYNSKWCLGRIFRPRARTKIVFQRQFSSARVLAMQTVWRWGGISATYLVWTQSIGFPTYCRVVTAIENVTSNITVAFVCKRKIAESIFTWFIYRVGCRVVRELFVEREGRGWVEREEEIR